jgi:hypothetical protein
MHYLIQRCLIGAGSSSWAGSVLKTQDGLDTRQFRCSALNSECVRRIPLAYVRCIAKAAYTPVTTVFYILTEGLVLRFHHWRWVPHLLSDDQKPDRAREALLAALMATKK